MNTLSISQINLESTFFREITLNSLSFSRFHFEITIFPKSLWIHYRSREINMNSLSASPFHYLFTVYFSYSPLIHFFRQITLNSLSASRFHSNTLSVSRTIHVFTFFFAILFWIHYLIPEITMLTIFREITINWLFFRDFTFSNTLSFSRSHFKITICFAISL